MSSAKAAGSEGGGSSCTWWQAVTGLIIRRLNPNPTRCVIRITRYRDVDERVTSTVEKRRMISVLLRISVPGRESATWISKSSYTLSPNLIIFFSLC